MSQSAGHEWRDQQAALNERLKKFLENPNDQQLAAVIAEMRAYADAARSGALKIPTRWTSYSSVTAQLQLSYS